MFKVLIFSLLVVSIFIGGYFIYHGNVFGNGSSLNSEKEQVGPDVQFGEEKYLSCDDKLVDPLDEFYRETDSGNLKYTRINFNSNEKYSFLIDFFKFKKIPIFTREKDYISVVWQMEETDNFTTELEMKGFDVKEASEEDFKMRFISGKVPEGCSHSKVLDIVADVWPESYEEPFIAGRAYDYEIDILRNAGIDIEVEDMPQSSSKINSENPNLIDGY